MKHRILLIVCLLFLFAATACVLESPVDSSLVSVTEDIVSESEEAPETEIEENGDMLNVSSPVAKEGGAVLIYNGEIAAEGCPEALVKVAERMGLEVLYFDSADILFEQLDDAALFMIGGTEDNLDPFVSQFTPEMQVELQSWIESGGGLPTGRTHSCLGSAAAAAGANEKFMRREKGRTEGPPENFR